MVAATRLSTNGPLAAEPNRAPTIDPPAVGDWLLRWEKSIIAQARHRFADSEFGDEPGWLVSPFLNRFYYGYLATQDRKWVANPEPIS